MLQFDDNYFMEMAYTQALLALEQGEVPVGAVIVCQNKIIAKAYNQTETLTDVTAHAEILAITAASQYLGAKYLKDCTLYVTLEPCVMCAGALYWAQLGKMVFGAKDPKRGFTKVQPLVTHPKTLIRYGIMEEECEEILKTFFKDLRT
ncbi:MAG: nucleoside deaminase [Bacteroidota bacterium]